MPLRFWVIAAVVAVLVTAIAIGSVFVSNHMGSPSSGGQGKLAVEVHDTPCSNCSHVWVTFSSVSVHEANASSNASMGGWTTLNVSGTTVDLEALNGSTLAQTIGITSLSAGHYEQVRLTISGVVVSLANGTNVTALVPNASSGNIDGAFNVTAGMTTTISIDIDLASSLHVTQTGAMVTAVFTPRIGSVVVV